MMKDVSRRRSVVSRFLTRLPTLLVPIVLALAATGASSQVIQGRVTGPEDEPVANVLVKLLDSDGVQQAVHLTEADGRYRLEVPAPGEYYIDAEALGWAPYRSTRFEMTGLRGIFRVDLLMRPEPIRISGLDVSVERLERVVRQVELMTGRNVTALRNPPIGIEELQDAWQRGWNVTDLLRRGGAAGVFVKETTQTVCIEFRRSCLPVYLNGMRVPDEMVRELPLEMLEIVVVLQPGETIEYESGGIMLFTIHWMQEAR
jgi:hypothetical protein